MTNRKYVIEEYEKLEKQYGLMPIVDIEKKLDIFIDTPPVIRNILSIFNNRINSQIGHIQILLDPHSPIDIIESGFYSEDEIEEIKENLKKFLVIVHKINVLFNSDLDEQVEFLKGFLKEYEEELKPFFIEFNKRHEEEWKKCEFKKEKKEEYFG